MNSNFLLRRLTTATVPARPSLSLSPWINQRLPITRSVCFIGPAPKRTSKRSIKEETRLTHTPQSRAINKPPSTLYRPFSHTTLSSSSSPSPFRLSSNNTNSNPNTSREEPEPELGENDDPLAHNYNPYKPKRQWPPDMTKLSPKHQFRLERKYRRRAALKFARPKWTKGTKLVQWGLILFTLVYAVFFMQWADEGSPFDELREAASTGIKAVFSPPPPPGSVRKSD